MPIGAIRISDPLLWLPWSAADPGSLGLVLARAAAAGANAAAMVVAAIERDAGDTSAHTRLPHPRHRSDPSLTRLRASVRASSESSVGWPASVFQTGLSAISRTPSGYAARDRLRRLELHLGTQAVANDQAQHAAQRAIQALVLGGARPGQHDLRFPPWFGAAAPCARAQAPPPPREHRRNRRTGGCRHLRHRSPAGRPRPPGRRRRRSAGRGRRRCHGR